MMAKHGKVRFEENRIKFTEWPDVKNTMPNQKLPVIEPIIGQPEVKIDQSVAISRFVAKKSGHYPRDHMTAAKCDALVDHMSEALNMFSEPIFKKGEAQEAAATALFEEKMLTFMNILEPRLDDGWLVGDNLTVADFWAGSIYCDFFVNPNIPYGGDKWAKALEKYPKFAAYGKRFAAANKAHLSKRDAASF